MKKIDEVGKISFSQSVKDFWKGYFDFSGRSTRAGYWWATVSIIVIYIIFIIFIAIDSAKKEYMNEPMNSFLLICILLFSLIIVVPSLSLLVRRLRDIGLKSKTILTIFILYYGLYGSTIIDTYSNMMQSLANSAYQYMEGYTPTLTMINSPFITFVSMTLATFFTVSAFLPTNMLATESNNPILKSIFASKSENT